MAIFAVGPDSGHAYGIDRRSSTTWLTIGLDAPAKLLSRGAAATMATGLGHADPNEIAG